MLFYKGYKIRIYPTKDQEILIWKHIHANRFIWNYMLSKQENAYINNNKYISGFDMCKMLTTLKKDPNYEWLTEVSNNSLKNTCFNLDHAYKMFFKGSMKHPRFKKRKKAKTSYMSDCERFYFTESYVKIQKVGRVKYKTDLIIPFGRKIKFCNVRVFYYDNKYFVSFSMPCESQTSVLSNYTMGIDLGVKKLAVVSLGDKIFEYPNINKTKQVRELEKQIAHLNKSLSRKCLYAKKREPEFRLSNNAIKCIEKLKKKYKRLKGIRNNNIHQTTHTLVSMLPNTVVMEDLNIYGMTRNRHLRKAILDQCFAEFIRQMKYKCERVGITFIQADRFFPSSKLCSRCGAVKKDLTLKDRVYFCKECGFIIDRDYNAAINLMKYAN